MHLSNSTAAIWCVSDEIRRTKAKARKKDAQREDSLMMIELDFLPPYQLLEASLVIATPWRILNSTVNLRACVGSV